jgi:hypothetical protein
VLTGQRAGVVLALTGADCSVGRHPASGLRFHAQGDASVSARHAQLLRGGGGWELRDLGSTNGTYLNGRRLSAPARLRDGDRIGLGPGGPLLEFRLGAGDAHGASSIAPALHARRARPGRRTALLAGAAAALVLAAGVVAARAAWGPASAPRRTHASAPGAAAPAGSPGPRAAGAPPEPRAPARRRPPAAGAAPRAARPAPAPASTAGAVDVGRGNRLAVARIWVEGQDGEVATGTAFAVRGDGTLVTNRHVVVGAGGAGAPRRIAVQFAGSSQVWPARVVAVSGEADLAVVKVDDIVGAVPAVRGFNLRPDTLAVGAPVVLAGFPGGGEPVAGAVVRPVLAAATLAAVGERRLEIFARSAAGASGSPVFDAGGQVVAVLYGGSPGAARPLVFAVPAAAVARLLDGAP